MNGAFWTLVRKELAELKRDRRVLLLTLILPVLIYPGTIGLTHRVQANREIQVQERNLRIGYVASDPRIETALRKDSSLILVTTPADSLEARVRDRTISAGIIAPQSIPALGFDVPDTVEIIVDRTRENGREARKRLMHTLNELRREIRAERWAAAGGEGELLAPFGVASVDVASASESSGAEASKLLVYLLLMTLFMAGSAFSTDIVAGEKERGTLETLFLAPIERSVIARSKLFIVAGGTTLTGALSLISLAVSYRLGLLAGPDGQVVQLDAQTLLAVALLILPLAVLLGAVLLIVSAWSRSLKEAQYYMLPVMLIVFVPALLSMNQSIELSPFVALMPIANVAFVMRDVISQQINWPMVGLVIAATLFWITLMSRWVTQLLSQEEIVLGFDPEPFFAKTESGRRRAAMVGMVLTVLGFFYLGQWMQSKDLVIGLTLSLWVLLPLLGFATVRLVRLPSVKWGELLSLRPASPRALLGAAFLGWGVMLPIGGGLTKLQSYVLPMPESQLEQMGGMFEGLALWQLVLLASFSPAICEELVFRGAFLGILGQQGSKRRAILWSAFFFALMHLSVFRLAPTFVLGVILAALVVRHRSIFPAMLLHLLYNGTLLVGSVWFEDREMPFDLQGIGAWGLSVALVAMGWWLTDLRHTLRGDSERLS